MFSLVTGPLFAQQTGAGNAPQNSTPNNQNAVSQPQPDFYRHSVALGLGQAFLLGDFSDYGDDEIVMDIFYQYQASYTFAFLANFHSHEFQSGSQSIDVMSLNLGIKSKLFDFDAFAPFVNGGLGVYWPQAKRLLGGAITESDSKAVFGLNFGTGMDLRLNDLFTVGFMLHYHMPFDVSQDNQTDIKGDYFKLLMNVAYSF